MEATLGNFISKSIEADLSRTKFCFCIAYSSFELKMGGGQEDMTQKYTHKEFTGPHVCGALDSINNRNSFYRCKCPLN